MHMLEPQCTALAQSQEAGTPCVWKLIFGRFLLRLSLIKPSQVMFMVRFSPTSLNFGYDFVLLVQFFGTPCIMIVFYCIYLYIYKVKQITKALQFWALNVFCARTADIALF